MVYFPDISIYEQLLKHSPHSSTKNEVFTFLDELEAFEHLLIYFEEQNSDLIYSATTALIGAYSNLKLNLMGSNQSVQRYKMKMTSNRRRPPREDDLKIWKVEYLSNHWTLVRSYSNLTLKLMRSNQCVKRYEMKTTFNGRWTSKEEDVLKI